MAENKKEYRINKQSGIIHLIKGCCYQGDLKKGRKNPDNYLECFTIPEAEAILRDRGIIPNKCSRCDWTVE